MLTMICSALVMTENSAFDLYLHFSSIHLVNEETEPGMLLFTQAQ